MVFMWQSANQLSECEFQAFFFGDPIIEIVLKYW